MSSYKFLGGTLLTANGDLFTWYQPKARPVTETLEGNKPRCICYTRDRLEFKPQGKLAGTILSHLFQLCHLVIS